LILHCILNGWCGKLKIKKFNFCIVLILKIFFKKIKNIILIYILKKYSKKQFPVIHEICLNSRDD